MAKPLDPVMIGDAVRHDLVVTAEDGLRQGGIGQSIREQVSASKATPVVVMGIPTVHIPHGKVDEILSDYGLDATGIASTVQKYL